MSEKKLMLYPIVSLIIYGIILVSFMVPFYLFMMPVENYYLVIILLFVLYVILTFVGVLFNAAIVAFSAERFRGRNPDFGDGLSIAFSNSAKLLGWALISATVGVILQVARSKTGTVGKILSSLIGMAWTYVTFFILPVLLLENEGVFSSVKNSASLFKQTWGETISGNIGFGIIFALLVILGIFPFIAAFAIGVPIIIVIVGVVLYLLVVFALYSAMKSVFVTALYHFAREGRLPGPYNTSMIPSTRGPAPTSGAGNWNTGPTGSRMSNNPVHSGYETDQFRRSKGQNKHTENRQGADVNRNRSSSTSYRGNTQSNNRRTPPNPPSEESSRSCPDCGEDLRWIDGSNRWYCDNCYQYK